MKICKRCKKYRPTDKHHIYGVENNRDEVVDICRECHMWVHQHPEEARKEGFMKKFDSVYRKKMKKKTKEKKEEFIEIDGFKTMLLKKKSGTSKALQKKVSSPDKWKLDFSKKGKKK